jgi:hypothetical protein
MVIRRARELAGLARRRAPGGRRSDVSEWFDTPADVRGRAATGRLRRRTTGAVPGPEAGFELSWWCGTCQFLFRGLDGANDTLSIPELRQRLTTGRSSPGSNAPTTAGAGNAASDDSHRSSPRHATSPLPRLDHHTRRVN